MRLSIASSHFAAAMLVLVQKELSSRHTFGIYRIEQDSSTVQRRTDTVAIEDVFASSGSRGFPISRIASEGFRSQTCL